MSLGKFQITANCYRRSNVVYMLMLHSKCRINVPIGSRSNIWSGNIWNVPNLLSVGKWWVPSTRAYNVLKMFSLVSRPPCPQCDTHPAKFTHEVQRPRIVRSLYNKLCSTGRMWGFLVAILGLISDIWVVVSTTLCALLVIKISLSLDSLLKKLTWMTWLVAAWTGQFPVICFRCGGWGL